MADAGYGVSAAFRSGLSGRGLVWAVGIPKVQNVYSTAVQLQWSKTSTARASIRCRARIPSRRSKHWPTPNGAVSRGAKGMKGPLAAAFATVRVRPAEGE